MTPKQLREISALLTLFGDTGDTDAWLSNAEAGVAFLQQNLGADRLVVYASLPHVLIQTVLAPRRRLKEPNRQHLDNSLVRIDESWLIEHASVGGDRNRVYLSSPFDQHPVLKGGEKLIVRRNWAGSDSVTTELSQKLVHALELHYVDERQAYCRLDAQGDVEDVIAVVDVPDERPGESVTAVTINAQELYEYALLAGMGLVVFFDFTRYRRGDFGGWNDPQRFEHRASHLSYNGGVQPGVGSFVNGWQVALPPVTRVQIIKRYRDSIDPAGKRYTEFIALDIRTDRIVEVTCDPLRLANYFQPHSDLPLQMSPAFFRSEVLHKYKADPDKYQLTDRSLGCRGSWHLTTYDVNDADQVHTYLRYLSDLPYEEQLYWRSFNERPKAPLSRRAFLTDFMGEFATDYDPLSSIKAKTERLDTHPPDWWTPRGDPLRQVVHYPVTSSQSEWAEAILALDQLVVEGFRTSKLRGITHSLGAAPDKEWGSIKLLTECIEHSGATAEQAHAAMQPLRDLHRLRTVTKGHAAKGEKSHAASDALREQGTFRSHFESLATGCDHALQTVIEALDPTPA